MTISHNNSFFIYSTTYLGTVSCCKL